MAKLVIKIDLDNILVNSCIEQELQDILEDFIANELFDLKGFGIVTQLRDIDENVVGIVKIED